jgi:hypothetical protein
MSSVTDLLKDAADLLEANNLPEKAAWLREFIADMEAIDIEIRDEALAEAANMAIMTANHLTILPPIVRKFPQVGGIIASKILELRTVPLPKPEKTEEE